MKKKIVLLSDDCRTPSGVGNISRSLIIELLKEFDVIQVAGAINHPEAGQRADLSESVRKETGIVDAKLTLYPVSGYGDANLIRHLIQEEGVDAIIHFTDPRFWVWLYAIEHEIRQVCPLIYYHLWDDLPTPFFNKNYYDSCDAIFCISKQSHNIVKMVRDKMEDWQHMYIPHGVNTDVFIPTDEGVTDVKKKLFKDKNYKFVITYNGRNARRKMIPDIILGYKTFCDKLSKEDADKCVLLLHTNPVDENGTNLIEVCNVVCPTYNIVFSDKLIEQKVLNAIYNISSVVINISSNEGWGVPITEALATGTPVIVNVTGGLQDQCRFEDKDGNWINFTAEFPTNHNGRYKKCGEWAFPIFPKTRTLNGSIPTPYIFDDRVSWEDVADTLFAVYELGDNERKRRGALGREWVLSEESNFTAENMGRLMTEGINNVFKNWQPRKMFSLFDTTVNEDIKPIGILLTE